jgi:hypothetical protein
MQKDRSLMKKIRLLSILVSVLLVSVIFPSSKATALANSAPEQYGTSTNVAGYMTVMNGMTVSGVVANFNVPTGASGQEERIMLDLGGLNSSNGIAVGVFVNGYGGPADGYAFCTCSNNGGLLFNVQPKDTIDAELYLLDQSTNQWLVFIEDVASGASFGTTFNAVTTFTNVAWILQTIGPLLKGLITFTNAKWLGSNSSGVWQPILSSQAASYLQITLDDPRGRGQRAEATEIPDPPGTSFTIIPCQKC